MQFDKISYILLRNRQKDINKIFEVITKRSMHECGLYSFSAATPAALDNRQNTLKGPLNGELHLTRTSTG